MESIELRSEAAAVIIKTDGQSSKLVYKPC